MMVTIVLSLTAAAAAMAAAEQLQQCNYSIDNPSDPRHGQVRAGDDFSCVAMAFGATPEACAAVCCASEHGRCKSFSFNAPWALNVTYMGGCTQGTNCCCLKDQLAPLGPNHWEMNITTGTVLAPPPPLCVAPGVCCSLNGRVISGACVCAPGWRGFDCGELDLLPVPDIKGAYQHEVNMQDCSTSCGPSSWGGLPLRGPDGKYHLFASQFVDNCTLAGWNPGSTVVRAVADVPEGPFAFAETVFPTFHHVSNPFRIVQCCS